jgi:hypothetical protein
LTFSLFYSSLPATTCCDRALPSSWHSLLISHVTTQCYKHFTKQQGKIKHEKYIRTLWGRISQNTVTRIRAEKNLDSCSDYRQQLGIFSSSNRLFRIWVPKALSARVTNHSYPSTGKVKNGQSYNSNTAISLHDVHGENWTILHFRQHL